MRGLAFEGGGARGAYQIGVLKALIENGYEFDGFVGTSIGAINAAMMAQGNFDKLLELWTSISFEQLFDEDEQQLLKYMDIKELRLNAEFLSGIRKIMSKIKDGGINTDKMKAFLKSHIDEEQIRRSGNDFGLATMSLSDRKPLELMLDDIPQGQLLNYIMASAAFPGFRKEPIDEKVFLDGGFFNNCPYQLLTERDYSEIIVIRTNSFGIFRKIDNVERIKVIAPQGHLGQLMLFSPEYISANIQLGYFDGLRFVKNLRGVEYYIEPADADKLNARVLSIPENVILRVGEILGIPEMPAKRMLFEKIIPQLSRYLKLDKDYDYADFAIAILDLMATQKKIERFHIYDYDSLCALVKEKSKTIEKAEHLQMTPLKTIRYKKKAASLLLGSGII